MFGQTWLFCLVLLGHVAQSLGGDEPLTGKVSQSTLYAGGVPERAVDGRRNSNWRDQSCTHTTSQRNPWWRLELPQSFSISSVTITNRQDCCSHRLDGAEIRIGNSPEDNGNANPRCALIPSIPAGASQTFTCNGMEGRFVNIVIPGQNKILTLCEVQVLGSPANKEPEFECEGM